MIFCLIDRAAYTSGGMNTSNLFKRLDRKNKGVLSYPEFAAAVKQSVTITSNEKRARETNMIGPIDMEYMLRQLDPDRTGFITERSFVEFLRPPTAREVRRTREANVDHASASSSISSSSISLSSSLSSLSSLSKNRITSRTPSRRDGPALNREWSFSDMLNDRGENFQQQKEDNRSIHYNPVAELTSKSTCCT